MMGKLIGIVLLCALISCKDKNNDHPEPVDFAWNFSNGTEGWAGDFTDYPFGEENFYELLFEHDTLPEPLDQNQKALKLSGNNHSDDLFMFVKKKVGGLEPNTVYYATFSVEFASDVPEGIIGVGGSPGESVYIKAGATQVEPVKVTDSDNFYRLNIDMGNQSQGGDDMVVIGNFANGTDAAVYTLKTVANESPFHVTTGDDGELWVIIGTDSGFEATTTIYYNSVKVEFY